MVLRQWAARRTYQLLLEGQDLGLLCRRQLLYLLRRQAHHLLE